MHALFRNPTFRRLFLGRLVTNAGDSLYYVAAMWLVYELTGSELYTGVAGFLVMAPAALQFLFGPLVDRLPLRQVFVGTQLLQGVLVLVVPAAAHVGALSAPLLLAVMPLLSLLNQPVYPAQSAALPRIVEQDELVAANSLFTLAYQGVDAAFNALGGVLIAAVGGVTLFLVDSVTFAVAVWLFAGLRIPAASTTGDAGPSPPTDGDPDTDSDAAVADGGVDDADSDSNGDDSYLADLREGIAFLRGTVVAKLLAGAVVVNFTLGGVMAVLPAYGDQLGGASAYGILTAGIGVGLLVGALAGNVLDRFRFGVVAVVGTLLSAVVWAGAVTVGWLPATAALFALAFVPAGVVNVLIASMVQALVPEGLLGRVSSVLGSASAAMTPVGALVGGAVAAATSTSVVLWGGAVGFAVYGLYVLTVPSLRRLPRVDAVSTLAAE
ncbi:MFS transporter [Halobium salinum]|uniref:MFS transporter n=1 Tax=Halobium salinum TaxID=1364940 RepID=A0ABD5PCB7_9EURY|nr:MFS transporter [Halobium salinum]